MLNENNRDLLKEGAKEYSISLSNAQIDKFSQYARLLAEWNEKINLTAITDPEGIVIKHFLDSLSISEFILDETKTLIDVGTGAGFPGIPLKIIRDNLKVTLLDSLDKRVKFLNEICNNLMLKDIVSVHGRAEDFGVDKKYREHFDFVTARAVASLPVLLEYCLPFVSIGGMFIAMKGPDGKEELKESQKALEILGGEIEDVKIFTLPNSDIERYVILIKKCRHTPTNYPRKSGKPTKQPIK
ncbi:MAG: 16S rRNA (guanine(527)-N(7))-methyltransferase RsmG [Clostridiaceae bacterium]|mgnify:CR=1 FL=1|nr:16S rRNA (guanine(527)-N(7))-methyltransferase RsmG [Clostridiaceae bacterium]